MKDPHGVLREKQQDAERVRKEIQALLAVIPLLADDQPTLDVMLERLLTSFRTPVDPPDNGRTQLELYYPFIKHLRMSEWAKR